MDGLRGELVYRIGLIAGAVAMFAAGGCHDEAARPPVSGGVVDSVVSREVAIEEFRSSLPRADSLGGGASSRGALVRNFVAALEGRDTTALEAMVMTKPEFGHLYYATNPQSLPPYELSPELFWFTLEGQSRRGLREVIAARAGGPLRHVGHRCEGKPSRQGRNIVWGPCVVLRATNADTVSEQLFAQIIERDGRFKFVSYANKLD